MKRLLTGTSLALAHGRCPCSPSVRCCGPRARAQAQGVTTGQIAGVVNDAQGLAIPGASVIAVHEPSGTTYEAVTRRGRPLLDSRRARRRSVHGHRGAGRLPAADGEGSRRSASACRPTSTIKLGNVAVEESVTVTAQSDPVFSSSRTGAATARAARGPVAPCRPCRGRITDITRLTPQYERRESSPGQDNRANNITVDGSYFNNSFGLGATRPATARASRRSRSRRSSRCR